MVQRETQAHKIRAEDVAQVLKCLPRTKHWFSSLAPSKMKLVLVVYVGNLLVRGGVRGIRSLRSFLVT